VRALPTLLLVMVLLCWWHSYWAMECVEQSGKANAWQVTAYRGVIEVEGLDPSVLRDQLAEAAAADSAAAATHPTTIPFEDVLREPDWGHTYRRTVRQRGQFAFEHFTLEPSPWDLSREDIALASGFRFVIATDCTNRWGFFFNHGRPEVVAFPFWLLALAAAIIPAVQWVRSWRRARRIHAGACMTCGYDLRATPVRCPECGTAVLRQPIK
jgi:hypothetical protein